MRLLGIAIVLAACTVNAAQQTPQDRPWRGGQGRPIERIEAIVDSVGVNAEQKAKIDQILASAREEARQLMQDARNMDPRDRRQRTQEFFADIRRQVEEQLTPEQREAFSKQIEEARGRARDNLRQRGGNPQQPGAPGGPRGQGTAMIDRLSENLDKLGLSAEQKQQTDKIIADLREKLQGIAAGAATDPQAAREEARSATDEARQAIRDVLTREQRQQLRALAQPPAGGPNDDRGDRDRLRRRGGVDNPPPEMAPPPEDKSPATQPTTKPAANAAGRSVLSPGDTAPNFRLRDLSGKNVELSALGPRLTVLVFGSYTCPHFRQRAAAINRLATDSSVRPSVFVIYTREAHATDEWPVERNRDENISIAQHKTIDDRIAAARLAREKLGLSTPILIDTMDDATLRAYGGHPNAAFVIGRDRRILLSQQWFEPYALRRGLQNQ